MWICIELEITETWSISETTRRAQESTVRHRSPLGSRWSYRQRLRSGEFKKWMSKITILCVVAGAIPSTYAAESSRNEAWRSQEITHLCVVAGVLPRDYVVESSKTKVGAHSLLCSRWRYRDTRQVQGGVVFVDRKVSRASSLFFQPNTTTHAHRLQFNVNVL